MHVSSSYANILGETNVQPREFPRNGSKAKDGKERRLNNANNNGWLCIANATLGGARKTAWAKKEKSRLKVGNNNGQLHIANATSGAHAYD